MAVSQRKKDILYTATGFTLLASFLFMNWAVLFHEIPPANRELAIGVTGMIDAAFVGNLVNYFFGGSMQQQKKNEEDEDRVVDEVTVTQKKSKDEGEG